MIVIMKNGEWEDVLLNAKVQIKNYLNRNKKGGALHSDRKKINCLSLANKRISSCSSNRFRASMTVEACFVLPFYLHF